MPEKPEGSIGSEILREIAYLAEMPSSGFAVLTEPLPPVRSVHDAHGIAVLASGIDR
jgi:hypothetical protein